MASAGRQIPVSRRYERAETVNYGERPVLNGHGAHYEMASSVSQERSMMFTVMVVIVCTALGAIFGLAVEKGRVFEPEVVYNQMLFKKFIMLKMFLSAIISGMFFLSLMSMLPFTQNRYLMAKRSFLSCLRSKGYLTVAVGGAILGSGMAVGGTCPGLILAQIGTGTKNSGYTLIGCLFGAVLYGFVEPFVTKATKPDQPIRYQFLYHLYGSPFFVMALPVAAALSVIVFSLEIIYPWYDDNNVDLDVWEQYGMFYLATWPPFMTGVIVGSLQVPLVLMLQDTIGGSSGYCTIASQIFFTKPLKKLTPYLVKYQTGVSNWWQVVYIISAMIGAYLSSSLSGRYGTIQGVSIPAAFLGGMMIVFGSRMAGGCTSGHGVSGIGLLNLLSLTTVTAMFVGGMFTANLLEWFKSS